MRLSGKHIWLVGVIVSFFSGNVWAENYYSVSLPAVQTGPVQTAAFSFRFHSATFLVPTAAGAYFDLTKQPGFAFNGAPLEGFGLQSIIYAICTGLEIPIPCLGVHFLNSSTGYELDLAIAMPSVPTSDGTYVLGVVPNLFKGNPTVIYFGYEGIGSLSVTPFLLPIGDQYCPAGANKRWINSTLGQLYDPLNDSCVDGAIGPLVLPPGDLTCAPGINGQGGFYDPFASYCNFGVATPLGFEVCAAGPYSSGGFYQPATGAGCDHGVVLPVGDAYCHRGPIGAGGLYIIGTEYCNGGGVGSSFPEP